MVAHLRRLSDDRATADAHPGSGRHHSHYDGQITWDARCASLGRPAGVHRAVPLSNGRATGFLAELDVLERINPGSVDPEVTT